MLQNTRHLFGRKLHASDGDIGCVADFYFDDTSWSIRYLVADTGSWLSGRRVLLRPHAFESGRFGHPDRTSPGIRVNLTRKQIENSPSVDTELPVSRQYEEEYHRYYGWPEYWQDSGTWGVVGSPIVVAPLPLDPVHRDDRKPNDVHLRSTKAVTGYHIEATDGPIGAVDSFVIDDRTWMIREVVVETGHWYAGKKIIVLPESIRRISYEDSTVQVNLTKKDLQETMENDVAQAAVDWS